MYFATRHPLASVAEIRPLGSLEPKFWINYSLIYIIIGLTCICIELQLSFLKLNLKRIIVILTLPAESKWFKMGFMICALWSFSIWSFNNLYGIDLHTALISQSFENEVNDWQDINFFDTQFVYIQRDNNRISNLLAPGFLEMQLSLSSQHQSHLKVINTTFNDPHQLKGIMFLSLTHNEKEIRTNFEVAQLTKKPSDVVFVMTRNSYMHLGIMMKKLSIPYKMRLARKSLNLVNVYTWRLPKYSLLFESISKELFRIQVHSNNLTQNRLAER